MNYAKSLASRPFIDGITRFDQVGQMPGPDSLTGTQLTESSQSCFTGCLCVIFLSFSFSFFFFWGGGAVEPPLFGQFHRHFALHFVLHSLRCRSGAHTILVRLLFFSFPVSFTTDRLLVSTKLTTSYTAWSMSWGSFTYSARNRVLSSAKSWKNFPK